MIVAVCSAEAAETNDAWARAGSRLITNFSRERTGIVSDVTAIAQRPTGEFVFVTQRGRKAFDGTTWRSTGPELGASTVLATRDGRWFDCENGRIWESTFDAYGREHRRELTVDAPRSWWEFQPRPVLSLAVARQEVFALDGDRVLVCTGKTPPFLVRLDGWAAALVGINDELFLVGGMNGRFISRWAWDTQTFISAGDAFNQAGAGWCTASAPRRDGGAWLALPGGAIFVLTEAGVTYWDRELPTGMRSPDIAALAEAPDGRVVVGGRLDGVYIHNRAGRIEEHILTRDETANNIIKALFVDADNGLWIASRSSLTRRQLSRRIVRFNENQGLSGSVRAIARGNGGLYVGTESGLFVSDESGERPQFRALDESRSIAAIVPARGDVIFTDAAGVGRATAEGVERLDPESAGFVVHSPLHPDWVFFTTGVVIGALHWQEGKWTSVRSADLNFVSYGFAADTRGWIWAVRGMGQVSRFRPRPDGGFEVEHLGAAQGLPDVWCQPVALGDAVLVAQQQVLRWQESNRSFVADTEYAYYPGLIPFGFDHVYRPPSGVVHVAPANNAGNLVPRPVTELTAAIVSAGFNLDVRAAALWWDADGVAWAGGEFGLLRCADAMTAPPPFHTPVVLHALRSLNDRSVLLAGSRLPQAIELPYEQRSLRVEAAFPEYTSTGFQRFRIHLEGFDHEWRDWSSETVRDYTNLPAGNYVLRIEAMDTQNREARPVAVGIRIVPPLHQTALAYVFY